MSPSHRKEDSPRDRARVTAPTGGRGRTGAVTLLTLACVGCLIVSVVLRALPPPAGIVEHDDLREGQLEAAAAMVMTVVAGVVLGRFRREPSRRNLLLPAALLVLVAANLFATIATPLVDSLSTRGFTTWSAAGGGALGALMLSGAALVPDRSVRRRSLAIAVVLGASAVSLVLIGLLSAVFDHQLPRAFETLPISVDDIRPFPEHAALLIVEVVTAAAFASAAVGLARTADSEGDELRRWMSVGIGVAACAFVNYAAFPSQFTELLYAGDLIYLVAIGILLYGAVAEITGTEAAFVKSAVTSERERVARELRAGVAQELAYIASQTQWFSNHPAERQPLDNLAASVERALEESRAAISALQRPADEPVAVAVGHAAMEVGTRSGARIELDLDERATVDRERRELLVRLVRESVTISLRQGKARSVSVSLRNGQAVKLRMTDDGEGLDLEALSATHRLGLQALRERAEASGATFTYSARAGFGSTIEVVLP